MPSRLASLPALALSALLAFAAAAFAPAAAGAQAQPVDSLSHLGVDAERLQAGEWRYQLTLTVNGQARPLGERDVSRLAASYGPTPSWRVVAAGGRGVLSSTDTLYLSRATLQPLTWNATIGPTHLAAAFALDTIFGAVSSPLGRENIVLPNPGRLVVSGEMLDALLELEPLAAGWRDSVSMLVVDPTAAVTAPATLAVDGEETVTVPAGTFDCWVVSVQAQRGESRLWVSKTGQVVVRSLQPLPQLGDAMMERVLIGR